MAIRGIFTLSILTVIILSGCSALSLKQEYVRADEDMKVKPVWSGVLFTIPEKRTIQKIVIVGKGRIQNIEIQARIDKDEWKTIKNIKRVITFPYEIHTMVRADAIRILQKTVTGKGRIETIELYKVK